MKCKRIVSSCFSVLLLSLFVFACGTKTPADNSSKKTTTLPQACTDACVYSDSIISVHLASQWINNYNTMYRGSPKAFFYSMDDVRSFLTETQSADGLRVYFSLCDTNEEAVSYVDNIRLLLNAVRDTTDIVGDSLLGYDPAYTAYLGKPDFFNGNNSQQHFYQNCGASMVSVEEASHMTKKWRNEQHAAGRQIQAYTFCLDYICALLDVGNGGEQASGIRFYIGMDANDFKLIMVAVDEMGNNIYVNDKSGSQSVDFSAPCPQFCGESNVLNSDQ